MAYDTTIVVGDIVTGYHKGIHRVDEVIIRKPHKMGGREFFPDPLVRLTKVLNEDGSVSAKRKFECDIGYCCKITADIAIANCIADIEMARNKREAILRELGR